MFTKRLWAKNNNLQPSKTGLRKLSTIFLLSVILFSEAGYFIFYNFQRYQIKQQVKRELASSIETELLEVIELEKNAAQIEWEEEWKEFFFNDDMYDVKRIEKKDGKTFLYCINDEKENQLLKKMVDAAEKNQKEKKNNSYKFQLPYFVASISFLPAPIVLSTKIKFTYFNESAVNLAAEIVLPPPRFA